MAGKEGNDSTETNSSIADAATTTATAPANEKVQPTEEAESTVEAYLDKEKAESNAESDEEVESETNIEINNTAEITTVEAQAEPEATIEMQSELETKEEEKIKSEIEIDVEADAETETEVETNIETKADAETNAETSIKSPTALANEELQTEAEPQTTAEARSKSEDERENKSESDTVTHLEAEIERETNVETEIKAHEEVESNTNENNITGEVQPQQNQQRKDEPLTMDANADVASACSSSQSSSSSSSSPSVEEDLGFSLVFKDFVDLQTRLVLLPYIEEEGKGAIVASYAEDDRFEGLLLVSTGGEKKQAMQTMDFTDILANFREHTTPICLKFEAIKEDEKNNEKEMIINVDHHEKNEISEEKKDDSYSAEDPMAETPKAGNHEEKPENRKTSKSSLTLSTSELSPKPTYLEKRENTPSREHTQSLNSVLDDHRNRNNGDDNKGEGHGRKLSSGMFALSAWGMRMKAQSEKLLATAKSSQQSQPAATSKLSSKEQSSQQQQQQLHCDMYLQTNLGTYFPISKNSGINKPLHLQAVTTSSLYCIRKSATEHCIIGRDTIYKGNPVRYSFQWYRSSSKKKSSRDRFPISPSTLYSRDNTFDYDESIGDSIQTSRRSRTYSSGDSVLSSCSSWSSSSNSSSSCSSYSMSTAGVTQHTFSVASAATRTTMSSSWIPLQGATGASFQPNTTLVGKKLRCIVTIRPVRGTFSDEEDESTNKGVPAPNSSAIMGGNDSNRNVNDISMLEDDNGFADEARGSDIYRTPLGNLEDEGVEKIVCELAVPIQADMIMFNGARQAMAVKGSASFGNLVGRGGGTSTNTPATATSACGKTFRIEVGTSTKTVLYTPPPSTNNHHPKPQRRFMNVNNVHIYCRSSPQDEYLRLTDVPLFQVTARASPKNSKYVDLLFPAIPPSPIDDDRNDVTATAMEPSTHRFLSEYCIVDRANCSESGIPRLELEAPNRMTRESFLLTLGIAGFRGRPAQLDNQMVLYRDDEPILRRARNEQQQQLQHNQTSAPVTHSVNHYPKNNSRTDSPSPQPQERENFKKGNNGDSGRGKNSGQVISGNLSLSPSYPPDVIRDSKNVLSPMSCQSNAEDAPQVLKSVGVCSSIRAVPTMPSAAEANLARLNQLEREMEMLRAKLARKDKIVTELQRQAQGAEDARQKMMHSLAHTRQELKQSQEDCERIQMSKRHVERSMQSHHEATQKLESDHKTAMSGFETKLSKQVDKIAELEKLNRALQNEKAILGATVEARESKLVKLEELQISNSELSKKVAQQGALESQLEETHKKRERLQTELQSRKDAETECRKELEDVKSTIQTIQKRMKGEQEKALSCQNQLEVIQKKNQQLKGERNSYKQKNESLSKEVARLCRGGKNIRDIEKSLADHASLLQETELLRAQKRKALEEAHKYRTSYEQAKAAEEVLSLKPDERETRRILERTAELERLLSEMTDYVSAKQMQLDTMKEINEELQREIHSLAQANLRRDEV